MKNIVPSFLEAVSEGIWSRARSGGGMISAYSTGNSAAKISIDGYMTPEEALDLAPVQGAVNFVAQQLAASRLHIRRVNRAGDLVDVPYNRWPGWAQKGGAQPYRWQSLSQAISAWVMSRLIYANSVIMVAEANGSEVTRWFVPGFEQYNIIKLEGAGLRENQYQVQLKGELWNLDDRTEPRAAVGTAIHSSYNLIDDPVIGVSPFEKAAPAFRSSRQADAHAELIHLNGGVGTGLLVSHGTAPAKEEKDKVNDALSKAADPKRKGTVVHLHGGRAKGWELIKFGVEPEKAGLNPARELSWHQTAAITMVPPGLNGAPGVNSWGSNTQALSGLVRAFCLSPHLRQLERDLTRLLPKGWCVEVDVSHMEWEADRMAHSRYLDRVVKAGILTPNEARDQLGYGPVEGGDELSQASSSVDNGGDSDSGRDDGDMNESPQPTGEDRGNND